MNTRVLDSMCLFSQTRKTWNTRHFILGRIQRILNLHSRLKPESQDTKLLQVSRSRNNLRFGSRSFRVSAVCTHHMELNSPQRSFLRISNNVSETSQNALFPLGILWRPLSTYYPAPQIQLFDFGALYIYLHTYLHVSEQPYKLVWDQYYRKTKVSGHFTG